MDNPLCEPAILTLTLNLGCDMISDIYVLCDPTTTTCPVQATQTDEHHFNHIYKNPTPGQKALIWLVGCQYGFPGSCASQAKMNSKGKREMRKFDA